MKKIKLILKRLAFQFGHWKNHDWDELASYKGHQIYLLRVIGYGRMYSFFTIGGTQVYIGLRNEALRLYIKKGWPMSWIRRDAPGDFIAGPDRKSVIRFLIKGIFI
jgi:hypothetical protein